MQQCTEMVNVTRTLTPSVSKRTIFIKPKERNTLAMPSLQQYELNAFLPEGILQSRFALLLLLQ